MMDDRFPYLLAFQQLDRFSGKKLRELLDFYDGNAEAAWNAGPNWSDSGIRLTPKNQEGIIPLYRQIDPGKLYDSFLSSGCSVTVPGDGNYPALLENIYDPPMMLFYYGKLPKDDEVCIAMVGSRDHTYYGRQVAEIFSRDLAAQDMVIVSGMARGIDSCCHRGALEAGGKTIAVLGSGLDVIYPAENAKLYEQICSNGAVISEFPLGTEALPKHFPRRNRIISGLSRGLLVVEAGEKSGTMLTVDFALQQGRDVFAVPGPITSPNSRGTNRLLKQGAKMALSAEDVRREYFSEPPKEVWKKKKGAKSEGPALSATEKKLVKMLMTPMRPDDILMQEDVTMSAAELTALLTMMEIRGLVKQLPGSYYQTVVKVIRP